MTTAGWSKVKHVFSEVAELRTQDRAIALERLAAGDPGLRREVEQLLDAHDAESRSGLDPAMTMGTAAGVVDHRPGDQVGRYKLVERLGEGGFGAVFVAEQTEPFHRRVALKIVKLGMDTAAVISRFEAERQALALMDHPGIARVYDAGATPRGRPYFVMELVQGCPITDYCDQARLTIQQRLDLFVDVCRAVQHAHQKGVIHRDLKPGNVLVSQADGRATPKVIDFGIAKAVHTHLSDRTAFTEFRQFLGTPEYMSPEQAAGSLDIDTRTDVYSLGVLLYQLLTGCTPVDAAKLRTIEFDEVRRIIREELPPKPSTKLSTMGAAIEGLAVTRGSESRRLTAAIKGELDWIVMKALEKDPSRRYNSPDALAADVERHQRHEPILAGPPTAGYRLRKFVIRRRGLVAAAGLVAIAFVIGFAGLVWGLVRATSERDLAVKATRAAEAARLDADAARVATEAEARKYKASSDFLRAMLSSAGPEGQTGRELTVREVLDQGAAAIDNGSLNDQPDVEATARLAIGSSYLFLGVPAKAEPHLLRALALREELSGPEHADVAECLVALARLTNDRNQSVEAEQLAAEAVRIYRAISPQHPDLWVALQHLAGLQPLNSKPEEAAATRQACIEAAVAAHGEDSREAAGARVVVALQSHDRGVNIDEALRALDLFRRAYGPKHPDTARAVANMGAQFHMLRRYDEADAAYREALAINIESLGENNPAAIDNLFMMAWLADSRRDYARGEELWRQVVERSRVAFGRVSGPVAQRLNRLGASLQRGGKIDEAEPVFREGLAIYDPPNGLAPDTTLAMLLTNIGVYHDRRREFAELARTAQRLLDLDTAVLPAGDWTRTQARCFLGACLGQDGRFAEAEPMLLESYEKLGVHPTTKNSDHQYHAARRLEELYAAWHGAAPDAGHDAAAARWKAIGDEHRERLRAADVIFRER